MSSRWRKSKPKAPKARRKVKFLTKEQLSEAITIAKRNGQERGNSKYWQELMRYA